MKDNKVNVAALASFKALHPAIAALETAIEQQTARVAAANTAAKRADRQKANIDPTIFTMSIEQHKDSPEELQKLRRRYDDELLTYTSYWLCWNVERHSMMSGRSEIYAAIQQALAAHAEATDKLVKDVLALRLVEASEVHGLNTDCDWPGFEGMESKRSKLNQAASIRALAALLAQTKGIVGFQTELKERAPILVPFVDCVNSKHPHSQKLYELLRDGHEVYASAVRGEQAFSREANGGINERQHANRLIEFLHQETGGPAASCAPNLGKQIEAQNERRIDYQQQRLAVLVAAANLRNLFTEAVSALRASVEEAVGLLGETEVDDLTTIDRIETLAIMINNCQSAYSQLRNWGPAVESIDARLKNDLSHGLGERAAIRAFEEVQRHYRPLR